MASKPKRILKLPKCNGQPQLWSRLDHFGIRILWPDGRVTWWDGESKRVPIAIVNYEVKWGDTTIGKFYNETDHGACTADKLYHSQLMAIANIHKFDDDEGCKAPEFLGYL